MYKNRTIITKAILAAVLGLSLLSGLAIAHGGLEHVIGTVASISDTSVTVKTADGKTVEVVFDAKTTYAKSEHPIQKTDIKVGDRVVIHAAKTGDTLTAHTVAIGTGAKAAQH
jgi:Domain of unknown function (DUF5666)